MEESTKQKNCFLLSGSSFGFLFSSVNHNHFMTLTLGNILELLRPKLAPSLHKPKGGKKLYFCVTKKVGNTRDTHQGNIHVVETRGKCDFSVWRNCSSVITVGAFGTKTSG